MSEKVEYQLDRDFAKGLDQKDPLAKWRDEFLLPSDQDGNPLVYFCGNSLGLQPKRTESFIQEELDRWGKFGVEGHFEGQNSWYEYHALLRNSFANLVGANPLEVVAMGSLTNNLHLMMVSFYRPTKQRYKIVIEGGAFPSDRYAVASQAKFHGFAVEDAIIELEPRAGEACLRTEDIAALLEKEGEQIALVMLSGVQFYTGQFFDLKRITELGHEQGCCVGFDLAHAVGNVPLKLHDWGVDFAAWCSYKYLNSGPGGVAGCFVHERHCKNEELPRFAGWWGTDPKTRFEMGPSFSPQDGADGWQLSNAPILSMAALRASMDLFEKVSMKELRQKSLKLTSYLRYLLEQLPKESFDILTPNETFAHGCQLSLRVRTKTKDLFENLRAQKIISDIRGDVIRIAPVPLYNTFDEVWYFCECLHKIIKQHA